MKVHVKPYIGGDNDILDKDLHPEVVVVKRCIESCSYCGDNGAAENQVCRPHVERKKTVIISYTSDDTRKSEKVRIPEHKKCKCK